MNWLIYDCPDGIYQWPVKPDRPPLQELAELQRVLTAFDVPADGQWYCMELAEDASLVSAFRPHDEAWRHTVVGLDT